MERLIFFGGHEVARLGLHWLHDRLRDDWGALLLYRLDLYVFYVARALRWACSGVIRLEAVQFAARDVWCLC